MNNNNKTSCIPLRLVIFSHKYFKLLNKANKLKSFYYINSLITNGPLLRPRKRIKLKRKMYLKNYKDKNVFTTPKFCLYTMSLGSIRYNSKIITYLQKTYFLKCLYILKII